MKTIAGLLVSSLLIFQAAPLRAQLGATIDLGSASSGELTVSDGTITIDSAGTISSGATVLVNNAATLTANSGSLVLAAATDGTSTNILAAPTGAATLSFAGTTSIALSSTSFQNLTTGATTSIVTGGTLISATNLTVAATTSTLTLGGTLVASGAVNSAAQQLVFPFPSTLVYTPNAALAPPVITASTLQSNVTAGLNFNLIPALTDFGGMGTTVQLLGGTASVNRTVLTAFSAGPAGAASDDVNVSGTITDTYVLELSYNPAVALSLPGGPNALRLEWLNPNTGLWENAIDDNTGGAPNFVDGPYNPATDFSLGTYGVDTADNTVWAVVDHNSQFTADSLPEPGAVMLLSAGLTGLLGGSRFRRRN